MTASKTLLLASVAALAGMVVACGVNEGDYVAANEEILAEIPLPEGAEAQRRSSSPWSIQEMSGPDGYTTNVVYSVPDGTTGEEIVEFYEDELDGEWEHCRHEVLVGQPDTEGRPSPTPASRVATVTFYREGALFSVLVDGLFPETYAATYEVASDHNTYRHPCTGEVLR